MSVKNNLYWNTFIRIPNQVVCFGISIIVARELTPNDFGVMAIAMMLVGYANLFSNVGFCEAIIQRKITNFKLINSIFTVDLCISTFLSIFFFLLSDSISSIFNSQECSNVLKVVCVVFVITSFEAIPHALLRRDMQFKSLALIETAKSFTMAVLTLILALLGLNYWALVIGQIVPLLLFTVLLCVKAEWKPKIYYDHSQMIDVYGFGLWNLLKAQTVYFSSHLDKIIIGRYLGAVPLGLYDKAMSVSFIPLSTFTMNINSVMFSSFSRCSEDLILLKNQFKKSLGIISVFHFPIYSGLIIIAPYFVNVLLGEKWSPMIDPFQIILVGCIVKSFGGLISGFNIATGNYKKNSQFLMLSTFIFLICALLLKEYGLVGVSFAFLLFCLIEISLIMTIVIKKLKIKVLDFLFTLIPAAFGTIIMYSVCRVIERNNMTSYTMTNMIVLIIVGSVVYLSYCLVAKFEIFIYFRKIIVSDFLCRVKYNKK